MDRDQKAYEEFIERNKKRTKELALRTIRLFQSLPRNEAARIIGRQLLRSATSVGANYRAACRVRTDKEFVAKLRIVCEESDESQYWMELVIDAGLLPAKRLEPLYKESSELTALFTKAHDTARKKLKQNNP